MKTKFEALMSVLPKKVFLVMAVLVTLAIVIDSALNASHVMVFFSLIFLAILFSSLYVKSEKHKLGVSISCLLLGCIYLVFHPDGFTWWRFSIYSLAFFVSGLLFLASWLETKHFLHRHSPAG